MTQALLDAGVLEEGVLTVQGPPIKAGDVAPEPRKISGFVVVSEAKLNGLNDEAVVKLHKSGAYGLAISQLLSMASLPNLQAPSGPEVATTAKTLENKATSKTGKKK